MRRAAVAGVVVLVALEVSARILRRRVDRFYVEHALRSTPPQQIGWF